MISVRPCELRECWATRRSHQGNTFVASAAWERGGGTRYGHKARRFEFLLLSSLDAWAGLSALYLESAMIIWRT